MDPTLLPLYDEAYQAHVPYLNSSLLQWAQEIKQRWITTFPVKVLELGCGGGELTAWLYRTFGAAVGIDFAPNAIALALKNYSHLPGLQFRCANVLEMSRSKVYELIFDSHCLHCIVSAEDRRAFFERIPLLIKQDGFLALETMVRSKFDSFDLDHEGYFRQQLKGKKGLVATRRVLRAREIEEEIVAAGLEIIYLKVMANLKIDLPGGHSSADLMRVLAKKRD